MNVEQMQAVCDALDVPLHMVTSDLPNGYWERQLARQVAARRVRSRLASTLRRLTNFIRS